MQTKQQTENIKEVDFHTVKSFTRTIKCVPFNDFVSY